MIVVDFPDPTNFNIGKLYTNSFYALLDQRLSASGYAVIQTTSPLVARQSFWTVVQTIESVGLRATPYHTHVPSFGEWGFVIASRRPYRLPTALPEDLRFMNLQSLPLLFDFPQDMARVPGDVAQRYKVVPVFKNENVLTRSGWTVLDGHTIHGYPVATFLRGKQMSKFDDGAPYPEFIGDADGHYLRRTPGQDLIPVAGGVGAMAEVSRTLPMIGKNEEGA